MALARGVLLSTLLLTGVAWAQHCQRYKRRLVVHGLQRHDVRSHLPQDSALLELRVCHPVDFQTSKSGELRWLALLLPASGGAGPELRLHDLGACGRERAALAGATRARQPRARSAFLPASVGCPGWRVAALPHPVHCPGQLHAPAAPGTPGAARWALLDRAPEPAPAPDRARSAARCHGHPASRAAGPGGGDYSHFEGDTTIPTAPPQREAYRQLADTVGPLKSLGHSGSEEAGIRAYYWDVYRGNAEVWQGREASETRLKALAPPRVLHLATHGFYLPPPKDQAERPPTLSGLALTGVNQGMQGHLNTAGDDGILYALEMQHLNLEGTQPVALSACQTGQGEQESQQPFGNPTEPAYCPGCSPKSI